MKEGKGEKHGVEEERKEERKCEGLEETRQDEMDNDVNGGGT